MDLISPVFPSDPDERRAWLLDRCREIQRRYAEMAEREMKPYVDMLAMLPMPRITVPAEYLAAISKKD